MNQLVDANIGQFSTVSRKEYTEDSWLDYNTVLPEHFVLVKVLQGDSGDNVIGVKSVGPVRAASLAEEYDTLENLIAALPIPGKLAYIKNLNEFGAEGLLLNDKLMNLKYAEEALGSENVEIINQVMENL